MPYEPSETTPAEVQVSSAVPVTVTDVIDGGVGR
jgi:hypothetical protein